MLYAIKNGAKIAPKISGDRAVCPTCSEEVVAKCGAIMIHHWSHMANSICVNSGETSWHLGWKSIVHPDLVEVVIGNHRADIITNNGSVLELQHSYISTEDILAREKEYQDVFWLLDWDKKLNIVPYDKYNYDPRYKAKWKGKLPNFIGNAKTIYFQLRNHEDYIYKFESWFSEEKEYAGYEWHPKTIVVTRMPMEDWLQKFFEGILHPDLAAEKVDWNIVKNLLLSRQQNDNKNEAK